MWTKKMPIVTNSIKKILVIQFSPFGDVFLASSTFETIKKNLPDAELFFLTKQPYHEAVMDHPFLDGIITFKHEKGIKYFIERCKLFKKIRDLKFDLVIDQQNNPGSQQISLFSGAKYRIGLSDGQFAFAYNYKVMRDTDKYSGSQKFDLLKPLGIKEGNWVFHFTISQNSISFIDNWLESVCLNDKNYVVMAPGSPVQYKKWRNNYFASLGDLIEDNLDFHVVLLGTKKEQYDCKNVYEHMKNKPIIAPEMTLNQAVALLKKAKFLVCNDGGLNHISCATETTTFAIFGTTNHVHWSPASVFGHHIHLIKPGYPSKKDDSFGISPQTVLEKIMEFQ